MILLVLVPVESPTGTLKNSAPMPQASLSPATIWLEAWGQDVGMPSVLGYIKKIM